MAQLNMAEIAKRCGVSKPTVSRVLNNQRKHIKKETREKVLKIVHELNYQPNYFAKSIRMGKTRCIGLMGGVTGITFHVPYYSLLATYTERALTELVDDYSLVLFGANHNQTYEKSMELISKGLVDGLVIIVPPINLEYFEKKVKPQLKKVNIPFVVIHSISGELNFNNVGFNSFQGGYLAGQHLVSLGYKDIGFYLRREENPQQVEIFNGFKKALDEHGIDLPDKNFIYTRDPSKLDHYYRALDTAKHLQHFPRAIMAVNDADGYGILHGLQERGIKVPEEVALIGFDDFVPFPYFRPTLTSVHHNLEAKGKAAVSMLLAILEGKRDRAQVHQKIIEPELKIRMSCGAQE